MIGKFFAPLAMKIGAGIILALLLALGVTMWRADSLSEQRDAALVALGAERAGHTATRASVAVLEAEMARVMQAARQRETALHEAERQAARDQAANDRAARSTQATIDRLRAIAARPSEVVNCEVDLELRSLAEGL